MTDKLVLRKVADCYSACHTMLLSVASRVDQQRFGESVGRPSLRLDWQLWHVARWTETCLAELFKHDPPLGDEFGPEQIWDREDLPTRWGLSSMTLGMVSAGTGLSEDEAEHLTLGPSSEVLSYARQVFSRADAVLRTAATRDVPWLDQADVPPAIDLILYLDHDKSAPRHGRGHRRSVGRRRLGGRIGHPQGAATLVNNDLLNAHIVFDRVWVAGAWERVGPAALRARERTGVAVLNENFEKLAARQRAG